MAKKPTPSNDIRINTILLLIKYGITKVQIAKASGISY
jgi:hypothetical protein